MLSLAKLKGPEKGYPHVVQLLNVFVTERHLCIVMEFVPGGTLLDYVNRNQDPRGRLAEPQARWLFQQHILATDYCHRLGVASRCVSVAVLLPASVASLPHSGLIHVLRWLRL